MRQPVLVTIPVWLRKRLNLVSLELDGVITKESAKAVFFEGTVSIRESQYCLNCGRQIENFKSRWVGYGPICSENLGIPRPDTLTEEQRNEIRERIQTQTQIKVWLPKSRITIVPKPVPPPPVQEKFNWQEGDIQIQPPVSL